MTKNIGFIIIIAVWFSAVLFSCHKVEPPKAVITIVDTGGVRVPNVKVTVYANPNGSYIDPQGEVLNDVKYTDAGGDASFKFKNKAILNAKAEQFTTLFHRDGKKLLILEEDKTVYITIMIK